MDERIDERELLKFFTEELKENLLFYWMKRCLDEKNGGYVNCFSNDGSKLVSTNKYTWSQGRFLWVFSRLALMEGGLFGKEEKSVFLKYAKSGRDFLMRHVLLGKDDYRCVFLTDAEGNPLSVSDYEGYDLSISADCFVVMGFSAYARAAKDEEAFIFAKNLGESVYVRYMSGNYRSLPYPVPPDYLPHARPMILTNMLCELYRAACLYDPEYAGTLSLRIAECRKEVFERFQDSEHLIHEFVYRDGSFAKNLFGQHINPGHTLEDMWFQMEASDILKDYRYDRDIEKIVLSTLEAGWDTEYKGLLHFVPCDGLNTRYQPEETAEEPQMKLVLDDWGSKLWWVHSEAMYTTLKMYFRTGKAEYADWFKKVFEYTYQVFPNPDRSIREWIQIRTREGKPQDKVVALPVKDPYHIIRNVLLIIELLEERKNSENGKSDVC